MKEEKERLINRVFGLVCKMFDLIDPETKKEKKQRKILLRVKKELGFQSNFDFMMKKIKEKNIWSNNDL